MSSSIRGPTTGELAVSLSRALLLCLSARDQLWAGFVVFVSSATDPILYLWPLSTTSSVWPCLQMVALLSSLMKVFELPLGRHWGGTASCVLCDRDIPRVQLNFTAWVQAVHVPV